jgi:3-phytase
VFWPLASDPLFRLVGTFTPGVPDGNGFPSSDHRLVAVDLEVPGRGGHDDDDD